MLIDDIIQLLEKALPLDTQEAWDNSGLQLGRRHLACTGVLLTLDVTEAIIDEAIAKSCNMIVAHHPLLFRGLKQISDECYVERCVYKAIQHDIAIYAAHTNADVSPLGLNILLAEELGLEAVQILASSGGEGYGLGAIGTLTEPRPLAGYLRELEDYFESKQIRYNSYEPQAVSRVALCGGAGASLWAEAKRQGADVFITGEAKYNDYFDAEGITLITVGHYESEFVATRLFERIISTRYPGICHIAETYHNPVKSI